MNERSCNVSGLRKEASPEQVRLWALDAQLGPDTANLLFTSGYTGRVLLELDLPKLEAALEKDGLRCGALEALKLVLQEARQGTTKEYSCLLTALYSPHAITVPTS